MSLPLRLLSLLLLLPIFQVACGVIVGKRPTPSPSLPLPHAATQPASPTISASRGADHPAFASGLPSFLSSGEDNAAFHQLFQELDSLQLNPACSAPGRRFLVFEYEHEQVINGFAALFQYYAAALLLGHRYNRTLVEVHSVPWQATHRQRRQLEVQQLVRQVSASQSLAGPQLDLLSAAASLSVLQAEQRGMALQPAQHGGHASFEGSDPWKRAPLEACGGSKMGCFFERPAACGLAVQGEGRGSENQEQEQHVTSAGGAAATTPSVNGPLHSLPELSLDAEETRLFALSSHASLGYSSSTAAAEALAGVANSPIVRLRTYGPLAKWVRKVSSGAFAPHWFREKAADWACSACRELKQGTGEGEGKGEGGESSPRFSAEQRAQLQQQCAYYCASGSNAAWRRLWFPGFQSWLFRPRPVLMERLAATAAGLLGAGPLRSRAGQATEGTQGGRTGALLSALTTKQGGGRAPAAAFPAAAIHFRAGDASVLSWRSHRPLQDYLSAAAGMRKQYQRMLMLEQQAAQVNGEATAAGGVGGPGGMQLPLAAAAFRRSAGPLYSEESNPLRQALAFNFSVLLATDSITARSQFKQLAVGPASSFPGVFTAAVTPPAELLGRRGDTLVISSAEDREEEAVEGSGGSSSSSPLDQRADAQLHLETLISNMHSLLGQGRGTAESSSRSSSSGTAGDVDVFAPVQQLPFAGQSSSALPLALLPIQDNTFPAVPGTLTATTAAEGALLSGQVTVEQLLSLLSSSSSFSSSSSSSSAAAAAAAALRSLLLPLPSFLQALQTGRGIFELTAGVVGDIECMARAQGFVGTCLSQVGRTASELQYARGNALFPPVALDLEACRGFPLPHPYSIQLPWSSSAEFWGPVAELQEDS